jgi:hypothetical protein
MKRNNEPRRTLKAAGLVAEKSAAVSSDSFTT